MPIDISLLRPSEEGGNIELVHRWQIIRNKINGTISEKDDEIQILNTMSSSSLDFLQWLMEVKKEKGLIKKELNCCRRDLKLLQRQLRPTKELKNKNDSNLARSSKSENINVVDDRSKCIDIREEIQKYKCQTIPQLEKDLHNVTTNIDFQLLPLIHNQIDEISFQPLYRLTQSNNRAGYKFNEKCNLNPQEQSSHLIAKKNTKEKHEIEIIDPLYAIGGYEKIKSMKFSQICSNNDNHDITTLTGVGSILEKVLTSHALFLLSNSEATRNKDTTNYDCSNDGGIDDDERIQSFQLINIPDGIQTELNLAHSIMGCVSSTNIFYKKNSDHSTEEQKLSPSLLSKTILSNKALSCHICNLKNNFNKSNVNVKTNEQVCDLDRNAPKIRLPSYVTFSMFHQDQNYSENVLPLKYISIIPYNAYTSTNHFKTNGIKFGTPQNNDDSISMLKTKTKHATFPEYSHPVNQLHLFALCACDLYSSRQIQYQFVNHILDFHESLIVGNFEMNTNKEGMKASSQDELWERYIPFSKKQKETNHTFPPLLRAYSLSSLHNEQKKANYNYSTHIQLQPNEASRIIIEGYLPSINDYIELGHVSNFTDYISRSLNTKFGGGSNLKGIHGNIRHIEYVHSIYGIFAPFSTSIAWMLENNLVCAKKEKRGNTLSSSKTNNIKEMEASKDDNAEEINVADGIVLPSNLVLPYRHMWGEKYFYQWEKHPKITLDSFRMNMVEKINDYDEYGFVIPFKRRKFYTKHGKPITRLLNKCSLLHDHYIFGLKEHENLIVQEKKQSVNEKGNIPSSASDLINISSTKVLLKHPSEKLTSNDISHEALSNPYDFLPFYK